MTSPKPLQVSKSPFLKAGLYFLPAVIVFLPLVLWPGLRSGFSRLNSTAPAAPADPLKNALVSIEARDTEVSKILSSFAGQVGATLNLDPTIRGKLSIQAEKSDLREVMDNLCQVYSCQWSLTPERVLTVSALSRAGTQH